MHHTQMESTEESTSLKPRGPNSPYTVSSNVRLIHLNREKRLESVRLNIIYCILWILLVAISASIPFYEWFMIDEPECWTARYAHIMVSVFVAMLTAFISAILCILNCITRISISIWRLNFCTVCFILLLLFSVANFLLAIYLFSMNTCYFAQITPADRLDGISNWFHMMSLKYDLKIVAILHLICCLLSFAIGIGFAIIKNNFKYVRHIDQD